MNSMNGQTIQYRIVRSDRKTLSVVIDNGGNVTAKAPMYMPERQIQEFVKTKSNWILRKQNEMKNRKENHAGEKALDIDMTAPNGLTYREWARRVITRRTAELAALMQVRYARISIRQQKTRWGSCSSKGNLNFHWRLVLMPEEVMDYVIVHELCHLKYMNHSPEFWKCVGEVMPDYQRWRRWLREY